MTEVSKDDFRKAIMEYGLKHIAFASPLTKRIHNEPDDINYYEGGGMQGEIHVWHGQGYDQFTVKYFLGPMDEEA